MSSLVTRLAADIIGKSGRENPADAVLREVLRGERNLFPADKLEITLAVFAYFRWRGWLDSQQALPDQIQQTRELAKRFTEQPETFSDDELAEKSLPDWARDEIDFSPAWVRAIQAEPKLWLRAKRGQGGTLAGKLIGATARAVLPDAVLYQGEQDLFTRPEFHAGEFEIQDIASQAVGFLCDPKPGETWWDACAGEGGKTMHLSDLMQNKGLIWASDRAEWRLKNLKRRAARAQVFNFRAAAWDGGAKLPTKGRFDGILVDAPCSGVGTWQRNPHARWTTTLQDVQELGAVQLQLLNNVAGSLKPDGRLIYSVCTLTKTETMDVVENFSKAHPELESFELKLPPAKENQSPVASSSAMTIWPQDLGGNGMFITGWRRKKV